MLRMKHSHKIWDWLYDPEDMVLLKQDGSDGGMIWYQEEEETGRGGRTRYTAGPRVFPTHEMHNCAVKTSADGSVSIASTIKPPSPTPAPENFVEVLQDRGCTWLWDNMKMTNSTGQGMNLSPTDGGAWLYEAIEENTLVGVTDGSYIRELCPHLCSAALIIECTKGRGRLVVSFSEQCLQANAYHGELLCLMALHLLLLAINKSRPELQGSVHIYSDCLGALNKVKDLPPHRIPSKCRHSDILKNILLHCNELSFLQYFSHVSAHQDDHKAWEELTRVEQLNSGWITRRKECLPKQ